MHSIELVGPGLIAFIAVCVLIWGASAFVAVDSVRRLKTDYAGVLEGPWFYAVPQALFFVAFLAWQIPWVASNATWVGWVVLAPPLVLAQQMAYLLRVVFPTAKRLEKRLEAERAAGIIRPLKGVGKRAAFEAANAADHALPDDLPGDEDLYDDSDDGSASDA